MLFTNMEYNYKYMKGNDENIESPYLKCWEINNLCGWAMTQKLPVVDFLWVKNELNLMKISYKNKMKIVRKDIFLKLISIS